MSKKNSALKLFGENLRKLRLEKGFSQIELALKAQLYFNYISMLERGEKNPTLFALLNLASALNVEPAELIKGIKLDKPTPIRKKKV